VNVLITSGATREPIDKVRFITNMSTGRTGAALADALSSLGHKVTYLHGEGAALPKNKTSAVAFKSFSDLDGKVKNLVEKSEFDVVIHAAAVSDYSIENVTQFGEFVSTDKKLDSKGSLELKLTPNYKILNRIKTYSSGREPMVIGFKLTYTDDPNVQEEAVEKLFNEGSVDLVVHNDLREMEEKKEHRFHIHNIFEKVETVSGPDALAKKLNELFGKREKVFEEIL
jgi:phosphopantothenoylcysteine synthetase/decarboxylase